MPFRFSCIQEKNTLYRLLQQTCYLHGKLKRRNVFVVFHGDYRLPRYTQQMRHVLLPQAARFAQFFDTVLHIFTPITPE
mgnify:CR=1 FL=1